MAKETFSAILMITSPDISEKEVQTFKTELRTITNIDAHEINEEDSLETAPFNCCTNAKSILTSIWYPQQ